MAPYQNHCQQYINKTGGISMISTNKSPQPSSPSSSYPTHQSSTNIPLIQVLTTLTQKLSFLPNSPPHEQVLVKLLQKIDPNYFEYKFSMQQTYDYELIMKCMIDYYNDFRYERIRKMFVVKAAYVNKFQHVFKLVLDLAMNCNQVEKQRYIEEIINMGDHEKEILMPYFDQVTKRKFITKLSQFHKYTDINQIEHNEYDQLLQQKDNQYQQLKQTYEQLSRSYYELLQNHNNMKQSYDRILLENTQIIQEKCQLMNQLGVHHAVSFVEIADKYKRDVSEFIGEMDKLHKEIDHKNQVIKNKDAEIKQFSAYGTLGVWEQEKNVLYQKIKKLETDLAQMETKQQKLKDELQTSKETISKLKQQMQQKQTQIKSLSKIKARYKGIKQIHYEFKKNFMQKTRQSSNC